MIVLIIYKHPTAWRDLSMPFIIQAVPAPIFSLKYGAPFYRFDLSIASVSLINYKQAVLHPCIIRICTLIKKLVRKTLDKCFCLCYNINVFI